MDVLEAAEVLGAFLLRKHVEQLLRDESPSELPEWVNLTTAAEYAGVSTRKLRAAIFAGELDEPISGEELGLDARADYVRRAALEGFANGKRLKK